jgi:hypothetical protein
LAAAVGEPVFVGDEFAYVVGEVVHPKGGITTVGCDAERGNLCAFALREALVAHARTRGLEAWVNRFREVSKARARRSWRSPR